MVLSHLHEFLEKLGDSRIRPPNFPLTELYFMFEGFAQALC